MKWQLIAKIFAASILVLSCNTVSATVTRYENTDTSALFFGSYDYDDVLGEFSNVNLKANFSSLDGPADYELTTFLWDYGLAGEASFTTLGPTDASYYSFKSSFIIFGDNAYSRPTLYPTDFHRLELFHGSNLGGVYTSIGDFNPEDPFAFNFYFTPRIIAVSSVPEPSMFSVFLLSPLIIMMGINRRRK